MVIYVYPRHACLPGECTSPLASFSTWNALGENLVDFLLHRVRSEGLDDVVGNLGLHGFNDVFLLGFSSDHQKGDVGKPFAQSAGKEKSKNRSALYTLNEKVA